MTHRFTLRALFSWYGLGFPVFAPKCVLIRLHILRFVMLSTLVSKIL